MVKGCFGVRGGILGRVSGTFEAGKKILGLEDAGKVEGVKVFHAGRPATMADSSLPAGGYWE